MSLRGRPLELALLVALSTLATVLAKTAYLAGSSPVIKGPLVAVALLGWLWLWRRVRAWAGCDRPGGIGSR